MTALSDILTAAANSVQQGYSGNHHARSGDGWLISFAGTTRTEIPGLNHPPTAWVKAFWPTGRVVPGVARDTLPASCCDEVSQRVRDAVVGCAGAAPRHPSARRALAAVPAGGSAWCSAAAGGSIRAK